MHYTLFFLLRKRATTKWRLAALLASVFGAASAYSAISGWWLSGSLAVDEFVKTFVLAGLVGFLGFAVTLEMARRVFPEKLVSLSLARISPFGASSRGLALVRGTFLGFALLGLQYAIIEIGFRTRSYWPDPYLFGSPSDSSFPAFDALANAVMQSFQFAFVGITLPVSLLATRLWRKPALCATGTALWVSLVLSGQVIWLQPWWATVFVLLVGGFVLSGIFFRYDLATLLGAMFTMEFWLQSYPNLILFRDISPSQFYVTFAIWLSVFLIGVWLLCRPAVRRVYRKVVAGLEELAPSGSEVAAVFE